MKQALNMHLEFILLMMDVRIAFHLKIILEDAASAVILPNVAVYLVSE